MLPASVVAKKDNTNKNAQKGKSLQNAKKGRTKNAKERGYKLRTPKEGENYEVWTMLRRIKEMDEKLHCLL